MLDVTSNLPTPAYHPSRQQCAPKRLVDHAHQNSLYHREQNEFPHLHEGVYIMVA